MSKKPPPPLPEPLSPLVDAHTHLDSCGARDADAVHALVDKAASVGVGQLVTVGCDLPSSQFAVDAAHWDDRVFAAVALHPTEAHRLDDDAQATLSRLAADPRVVAIGETGLDYYWPGKREDTATIEQQRESFIWHIELAKRVGKPGMIHKRDADEDTLAVLDEVGAPETVIFHCFSGPPEIARRAVAAGYVLSFSGTVTFKNSTALQEAAALVPDDQLLIETDAPYLTPHPYRGTKNESYCIPYTARALAEYRSSTPEAVAAASTATARRVFRLEQNSLG